MSIQPELRRIVENREIFSQADAMLLMQRVLAGHAPELELAALLGALAARGESAAEIAGFASAMRAAAIPLPLTPAEQETLVDTCGTGGDSSGTFNISTAAALLAAAAGARVAKHGNRAITSRCGSADVLDALGIPTHLTPPESAASLREHGFAFLLAPSHHPALAAGMSVRRALGVRTVLHVLGPLLNPAGARRQVMGVYSERLVPLVAEAMTLLDIRHAFVVHGHGTNSSDDRSGLDELSLSGPSLVAEVRATPHNSPHSSEIRQYTITPEDFGLQRAPLTALAGGDAAHNAALIAAIFHGEPGPRRDVVLLNAGAVLAAAGIATTIAEGIQRATAAIDSGAATRLVATLQTSAPTPQR